MSINEYAILIFSSAGLAWLAFDRTAKVASVELKDKIREGFKAKPNADKWPDIAKDFITDMFGKEHWKLNCLKRSAIISVIWMVLLVILLPLLSSGTSYDDFIREIKNERDIISIFLFFFTLNILPDYISVWETRVILSRIGEAKYHKIPVFLIVDFLLTALIFFVVSLFYFVIFLMFMESIPDFNELIDLLSEGGLVGLILTEDIDSHVTVFGNAAILTTFLTSIWIWFYLIALSYSKFTNRFITPAWNATLRFIDIEAKPVEALGFVSALVVLMVGFLFSPIVLLV